MREVTSTKNISVCPECDGKGYITYEKCTNYHNNLYDKLNVLCEVCNGKGIVNREITVITNFMPIEEKNIKIEKLTKKEIMKWTND